MIDENIRRYFEHLGITDDDIVVNDENEIAFKTPNGIKSIVKGGNGKLVFYPDYSDFDNELKRQDRIYNNHKKVFDSKNDTNLQGMPLLWAINDAADKWEAGFNDAAKKANIPMMKRGDAWGNDDDVMRNYKRWLNSRNKKVFNMSEENLNKMRNDPYYQNYEMREVAIKDLINDQTDLSNHNETWGDDRKKYKYDPAKDKHVISAVRHPDGNHGVNDGRHRLQALENDGYTHVNIPVLDEEKLIKDLYLK